MTELTETTMTSTTEDVKNDLPTQDVISMIIRSVTILLLAVLAVFGNSLVVSIVVKYKKLRTSANVFVCNLSLVGIFIGMMLPVLASNVIKDRFVLYTIKFVKLKIFFVYFNNNNNNGNYEHLSDL